MSSLQEKAREALNSVNRIIIGKNDKTREILLAFLADGHIMLEDIPGVGKTTLAMAFSKVLGLECNRIQFTPDVMPSDLTGFSIYNKEQEKFVYMPGSVFCNLLLADEINRTSPKTQSALLEVMEERRVTAESVTREVPKPFLVIATQNPFGSAGTQYLPDSQIDRFMISMTIGYPDFESELKMAKEIDGADKLEPLEQRLSREELIEIQKEIHTVYISDEMYEYILNMVTATRGNQNLSRAAGPRATIAMVRMCRAAAWLEGRGFVTPADALEQFPFAVRHRIYLSPAASANGLSKSELIAGIAASVKKPPMGKQ